MYPNLRGKVCVVTGASGTIGRAIALRMAKEGCKVVVHYNSDEDGAKDVLRQIIASGGKASLARCDLSVPSQVKRLRDEAKRAFGRADILVNNAGIFMIKPATELTAAQWNRTIGTNLTGAFFASQLFGSMMTRGQGGAIVNVASIAGVRPFPFRSAYAASKAAMISFTKTLAVEWAKNGVRVNAVAPAFIESDSLLKRDRKGELKGIVDRTPMHRLGKAAEVAAAVAFLSSEEASYVTGDVMLVDGGWDSYGFV